VREQIKAVLDDIPPAAIKIGMVPNKEVAEAIAETMQQVNVPIILDPVLFSGSGRKLATDDTIQVFLQKLFPLCTLVTPNINEATALIGISIHHPDDMKIAARQLLKTGCKAVLITGGHLEGDDLHDVLVENSGREMVFTSSFIESKNLHGTGCTLASAIAAFLAKGNTLDVAIEQAITFVQNAIEHGKDVQTGEGAGPLNHFYNPQKLNKYETR
jgi:hydroxymethylpyrimidine/phosphomethylpyrimidine kinase